MVPATRQEFKDHCLRRLGWPVIEINVDDDQVDDRVDEALRYYWDYHFDGTEKMYFKYVVQDKDRPGRLSEVLVTSGGTSYSNADAVVITPAAGDITGSGAVASITTNANGVITSVNVSNAGSKYRLPPVITVSSGTGSGATFQSFNGGYITIPENIIGIVNIFPVGDPATSTGDLFNIRYQIALNDLYTLTSVSMIPYYMVMTHLALIQEMLVGKQPLRYNRHTNRMYVDANWDSIPAGYFLLVEAYNIVDPNVYTDVWGDRWLSRYASALIKKQWGSNLTKFSGLSLPGGVQFNGEKIYNDAQAEIDRMEEEMIHSYSLPATDMIG
jgi:hypothetical protein